MTTSRPTAVTIAGFLIAAGLNGCHAQALTPACEPTFTVLPRVGSGNNEAIALNEGATVVGYTTRDSTLTDQTVLWRHGIGTILPLPDGVTGARPRAMNASGDVVGEAYTQNGATHAFFSDGQTIVLLPDLPGSTESAAYAINAVGQIVGTGRTAAGEFTALLWASDHDQPIQLQPVPPDSASFAQAVSDTGAVGGTSSSSTGDRDVSHAVIWAAGAARILDSPAGPGAQGQVMAVNAHGVAAGESAMTASVTDPAFAWHATLWTAGGTPRDIGTLAGDNFSLALGLSTDGAVVGMSAWMDYPSGQPAPSHAFIWTGHGPPQPLPLPAPEGALGSSTANAIDNHGDVAGSYTPPSGKTRAVLWTCAVPQ